MVVPVGTTGESATLDHEEHRRCIEIAADICAKTNVKVLAELEVTQRMKRLVWQNLHKHMVHMVFYRLLPYYNKPTL